jgi:hypothetical protein
VASRIIRPIARSYRIPDTLDYRAGGVNRLTGMERTRTDAYVAIMTDGSSRHEREEAARREALRTLDQLRERDDIASSALTRAARRATDHFAAKDAMADAADDRIELWGRRIGRGLSLAAFIALAIYLYVTYFAR